MQKILQKLLEFREKRDGLKFHTPHTMTPEFANKMLGN